MDISNELLKINQTLSSRGIKLRIESRGKKINIRGPLPCKKTNEVNRVQRISLGLNYDIEGLKEGEKIIELILLQLDRKQFDWNNWSTKPSHLPQVKESKGASKAIEIFKEAFFSEPNRRHSFSGTKSTWRSAYLPYLRRLEAISQKNNQVINQNLLIKTLESYEVSSRSRQQCSIALAAFARHFTIVLPDDWRANSNGYGLHKAKFRELPSDKQIVKNWQKIPNKNWKLAFGLMATYGLRNHEIFFCDLSDLVISGDNVIRILPTTKTGEHQAWPFLPEWVELFGLGVLGDNPNELPKVNTDLNQTTLQQVGKRVSEQFRRYNLSITPYDLRHAWAIRTIHLGLPDSVASRMMGHSVAIHTRTYHHWITRRDQQKAVDAALSNKSA